ncbi:TIGR03943 family protein [Synechococcus sp. PCC 6312]|uniref:TIGR03943 family putative permease subunit n=1 Tax=Synechococcus sp. (strain ATCC 27167 / PCC 6312) TaxID=195253 RepID=UPI00029ED3F6|nr:TIGR03943 family protein [Synechococcus sp. PCC 6312]AFY62495.1 TIGR03943 family protein [Synechococcus sp. PCC 6312]
MQMFPVISKQWYRQEWVTVLALGLWGILFLVFWLWGRLGLLIHPNYFPLAIISGFILLGIAIAQARRLAKKQVMPLQHLSLLPPSWMSWLLVVTALIGLFITPRPFNSDTAVHRGLGDGLTVTRNKPQAFRANTPPEQRTLVDWVRTLDIYPEPDAYGGLPVDVEGFAVHPASFPDDTLTLARFVITCCAADAYPVGLAVKLPQPRAQYPADQWYRVKGRMITATLDGQRQLTIQAREIIPIPQPDNPFAT